MLLLAVARRLFRFGPVVDLDVVCGYFSFFSSEIKIENRYKLMFSVRLAGMGNGCSPGCR